DQNGNSAAHRLQRSERKPLAAPRSAIADEGENTRAPVGIDEVGLGNRPWKRNLPSETQIVDQRLEARRAVALAGAHEMAPLPRAPHAAEYLDQPVITLVGGVPPEPAKAHHDEHLALVGKAVST